MNEAGILTGPEIIREVGAGNIHIEGFDPARLVSDPANPMNPASYDLRLGDKVAVYRDVVMHRDGRSGLPITPGGLVEIERSNGALLRADAFGCLDSAKQNYVYEFTMPETGWIVTPGIGYLMHTKEAVFTDKYVPIIEGKSSIGRLFCTAHVTAGYGDPGFNGEYTLEVVSTHRVVLYPGMRFCQIRFTTKVGEHLGYNGNYVGSSARGPVPSRSWRQFEK